MIKRICFLALAYVACLAAPTLAAQPIAGGMGVAIGDASAGKSKSELCQGCHGVDGISIDPTTFPNLAGQYAGYIFKQVQDFQLGNRSDDTMVAMAATVANLEDLRDIAAYYAAQKMMKGTPTSGPLAAKGRSLYNSGNPKAGVYACVNCHGNMGKGKGPANSLFPVIGGQTKAYLIKQLKDLRSGKRGNDPAGMMGAIAKKLSDKEIMAVAEFLSGQ